MTNIVKKKQGTDVSTFTTTLEEFLGSPISDACFLRAWESRLTSERVFIELTPDGGVVAFSNLTRPLEELRQAQGVVIELELAWLSEVENVGNGRDGKSWQLKERERLHRFTRNSLKSELHHLQSK